MVNIKINSIEKYLEKKENKNIINNLVEKINWIESYSDEIILIEKIFIKLELKISNLYKKLEEMVNKKIIIYKNLDNKYNYFLIINEVFFILINSIIRCIYSKNEILNKQENNLINYISEIKIIYKKVLQLENDLNLYSQEILTLKQIIDLIDLFSFYEKINLENFKKIFEFFGCENELFFDGNKNINKLCNELNDFYRYLIEILKKDDKDINNNNIYKIISDVLYIEYKKIEDINIRLQIIEIILNNDNLIKNSTQIFKIIIDKIIKNNHEEMINNLDKIKKEKLSIFQKINYKKSVILDEIIMNIFEGKIMIQFEYIKDLNDKNEFEIYFDNSIKLFEQCIQVLDNISNLKENEFSEKFINKNIHLCKLYSVVYVKIYLNKFIFYIKDNENNESKHIFNIIKDIKNSKFKKVIKIYILKLYYYYTNHNFDELKYFNYKYNIEIENDFPSFDNNEEIIYKYYLFPIEQDDYKKYSKQLNQFENIKHNDYVINNEIQEINDLDIFLTVSINKIFLNLSLSNYFSYYDEHKKFCTFCKPLLENNYRNNPQLLNLLNLFYDSETFKEKIFYELINKNSLEIIIYGFRYCVQSLSYINNTNDNGKYLYKSLLTKENIEEVLNEVLIPGIDTVEDLHLSTIETIITHLNTKNERHGCYVCSCGYYYDIDPCGFPTKNRTFDCPVCGLKIGWGPKKVMVGELTHGMVIRPGHYRIFKNEKQKKSQMKVFDEVDENIPNILLPDYINEVVEPIRKKSFFGFSTLSKDYFQNNNKKIRNLSHIKLYFLLLFIF